MESKELPVIPMLEAINGIPAEFYTKIESIAKDIMQMTGVIELEGDIQNIEDGKGYVSYVRSNYKSMLVCAFVLDKTLIICLGKVLLGRGKSLNTHIEEIRFEKTDADWQLKKYHFAKGKVCANVVDYSYKAEETLVSYNSDDGLYAAKTGERFTCLKFPQDAELMRVLLTDTDLLANWVTEVKVLHENKMMMNNGYLECYTNAKTAEKQHFWQQLRFFRKINGK